MNGWMDLPWLEMLLACEFLLGIIIIIVFIVNKYPSSRTLGLFIATILLLPISILFKDTINLYGIAISLSSISFFIYCRAFFIQNTRGNLKFVIPLFLVAFASLIPKSSEYHYLLRIVSSMISIGFLFLSYSNIRKEGRNRGISWLQNSGSRLIWFRNFTVLNSLLISYWLIAYDNISISSVGFGLIIILGFVYYQIFKESTFLSPIPLGNKYQKSTLTPAQKAAILSKLDLMISKDKFYLNDNISLQKLATELHTTTHHLSQVINETKGNSFQDLISKLRIREAKLLLKDPKEKHTKIENIAAIVGYNSKSAFNTAFKKHTGSTPSEFKSNKNVAYYREDRLPEQKKPFYRSTYLSSYHVLSLKFNNIMVSNFIKIFYRTMLRNKVFSAINLFGLTLGFCCSILIYLFISDELSYDKELPDSEKIFRVSWLNENPQTRTPHPLAQAITRDMPEVEAAVSISPWYGPGLSKQNIKVKNVKSNILFDEPDFYFADSTFLDVFQLELVAGDIDALKKPWNIVITEQLAFKYFGVGNPIGQELIVADMPVAVAAVIKGMPDKSHFHFNALMSYVTIKAINPDNPWMKWEDFGHFNYIKIKENIDPNKLEAKIPNWIIPYLRWNNEDAEASLREGNEKFELQPITDIHLNSHLRWELESNGNVIYVYILTGALAFILLIISINYINLTTAKSSERAKEIGIRKTLGAVAYNLNIQFYLESLFFCLIALLLAFGGSALLLDSFNQLANQSFTISDLFRVDFVLKASAVCVIIALLSAFYPALTLASFIPSDVLKGNFASTVQGNRLRSILVVLQFFVSAILIAGSLIIIKQIDFMKNKDLGFDQDAIISINVYPSVEKGGIDIVQVNGLLQEFEKITGVKSASSISNLPGKQFNQNSIFVESAPNNSIDASELYIGFNTLEVLNLQITKGRNFDNTYATDSSGANFILNESAMNKLNLDEPIGKYIIWDSEWGVQKGNVIGVVKDFHYKSLHDVIQPLIIKVSPYDINHIIVKIDGENFQKVLSEMEIVYQEFEKELPFEYHFLDQQLAELYGNEVRIFNIFSVFASVALFLACLGLFGLALAILKQKTKEVGIRKIMGASSRQIAKMIFSQFSRLIAVALILGLPVAYLLMQNWLSEFSYQVTLGMLPFLIAAVILFVVSIVSVSLIVVKIANANPIEALRYE